MASTQEDVYKKGRPARKDNLIGRGEFFDEMRRLNRPTRTLVGYDAQELNALEDRTTEGFAASQAAVKSKVAASIRSIDQLQAGHLLETILLDMHDEPAFHRMVVESFQKLMLDDPVLAMELRRIVQKAGGNVVAERKRQVDEVKRLIHEADMAGKASLIKDLSRELEHASKVQNAQNETVATQKIIISDMRAKSNKDESALSNEQFYHQETKNELAAECQSRKTAELKLIESKDELEQNQKMLKTEQAKTTAALKERDDIAEKCLQESTNAGRAESDLQVKTKLYEDALKNQEQSRKEIQELRETQAREAEQRGGEVKIWSDKYRTEAQKLADLQNFLREVRVQNTNLASDVNSAKEELKKGQKELKDRTEQAEDDRVKTRKYIDELRQKIDEQDTDVRKLRASVAGHTDDIKNKVKALEIARDRVHRLTGQRDKLEDELIQKEQSHRSNVKHLGDIQDKAVRMEKQKLEVVSQQLDQTRADLVEKARRHDDQVAKLQDQLFTYEKDNTGLRVKCERLNNALDEQRKVKEEIDHDLSRQALADMQEELEKQAGVGVETEPSTHVEIAADSLEDVKAQLTARETLIQQQQVDLAKALETNADLKRLIVRWGFGGDSTDLDVSILKALQTIVPVSEANLTRQCEVWESAIQCGFEVERVTGLELWVLSTSKPSAITIATIYGFVKSRPVPSHLIFLEKALRNIAALSEYSVEQCFLLLRGLELLWMTLPDNKIVNEILQACKTKLCQSILIDGLHAWLRRRLAGSDSPRVAQLFQLPTKIYSFGGSRMFEDGSLLIATSDEITFVTYPTALKMDLDAVGSFGELYIQGPPALGAVFKHRIEVTVDLLRTLFEGVPEASKTM